MATVTRTFLVDDLDGTQDDVQTVQFSIDQHEYQIDLSADNATRLRDKLARFVEAAHHVQPPKQAAHKSVPAKQGPAGPVSKEQTQAIRHWARENGYAVSERGRIPTNVREAFEAAH